MVFGEPEAKAQPPEPETGALELASYLRDSFSKVELPPERRARVQRRLMRALGIPQSPSPSAWERLEIDLNRHLGGLDPRWTRLAGTAALVLLGLAGIAYWRQRSAVKPVPAALR